MASQLLHTVKPSGGDFTSLDAAIDHLVASHANLVTADVWADVEISGSWSSDDTTPISIDGLTTDATHYLNIYCTGNTRHDGKWNESKYVLRITTAGETCITISDSNVFLRALQVAQVGTYNTRYVITSTQQTNVLFDSVISKVEGTGGTESTAFRVISTSTTKAYKFKNCIAINPLCVGFYFGSGASPTAVVYNCVAISCGNRGFDGYGGRALLKNCVAHSCNTDFNDGLGYTGSTNNASEDSTAPTTEEVDLNGIALADIFVDAGNYDFHLKVGSALIDQGADLYSDSDLAVTTDIDGTSRDGLTFDIGADEYVAGGGSTIWKSQRRKFQHLVVR